MPAKKVAGPGQQEFMVLEKFDDIRLVMSEKHNRVLTLVTEKELSISDLARALEMNPGAVHYYLKDLEKHRLVRLVREEVKGGVVKKYYLATARRIVLEMPRFSPRADHQASPPPEYVDRLIRSIEYLGYHLAPENREDAHDLLFRYDKRIKSLMNELQQAGLDDVEEDGLILNSAYTLVLGLKVKDDPELNRLYSEFQKLFHRYE